MNTAVTYTTLRDLARQPKKVIDEVKKSKQAKVVISKKEPQAVIVSLEDYQKLETAKTRQATLRMLQLALDHKKEFQNLPADLRKKANQILYIRWKL